MNLEKVEERGLSYLRQSPNPLVAIPALLEHIKRDKQCVNLEDDVLRDFLRDHEQVTLIDMPQIPGLESDADLSAAGLPSSTRAILNERVPSPRELGQLMDQQMDAMITALKKAIEHAANQAELSPERKQELEDALERTEALQRKMRELL